MKINLTEIERCAREATGGTWGVDLPNAQVVSQDEFCVASADAGGPNGGSFSRGHAMAQANAAHIAGNHPAVTLAFCEVVKAAQEVSTSAKDSWWPSEKSMEALRRALAAFQEVTP